MAEIMARVKVYQLNNEGQWDDKGTGNVCHSIANDGEGEFVILTVQCEETHEILLEHRIEESIEYSRQGGTIITWCEPNEIDLALSFQEVPQCDDIWEQITNAQKNKVSGSELMANEDVEGGMEEEFSPSSTLPFPELSNLSELCTRISKATPANKDMVANRLLADGYLKQLFTLFHQIEKDQQLEQARVIFNIFKGMFLLNDQAVLEVVLGEDNIVDLLACLEYDPLLPPGTSHRRHRDFIASAQFKQPIPIPKPDLLAKIHLNYRMIYIKDVILLRYLDDTTMATLNSLIFFNNLAVVTGLSENEQFMKDFFSELHRLAGFSPKSAAGGYISSLKRKSATKDDESEAKATQRKNLFLFLQELCLLAKTLQIPLREEFYKKLDEYGMFRAIEDALAASPPTPSELWLWLAVADIITNALNHDPALLRSYMNTRLSVPKSLLGCLVEAVVSPEVEAGLADQLAQILRMVLDPDSMQTADKDAFLDHFYAKHIQKVVAAVSLPISPNPFQVAQYQACELLSCCVHQHGYRIKQHILNHDVTSKVAALLKLRNRPNIVCSAVRFLRTCIGLKDDMISRQMCNRKVLDQMVDVFAKNGSRYNLLNSSVIEVIHFIRQENIKILVDYLVTNHEDKFAKIDYVQTFQELKLRWEQNHEYAQQGGRTADSNGGVVADDQSQYSYFEKDSDDEEEGKELKRPAAAEAHDEKQREFLKQTELLLKKRAIDDDEVDLVSRIKRKPQPTSRTTSPTGPPGKPGITMAFRT